MKVSRVLHAGYIFESGETRLLFDPIFENPFSVNCFSFPAIDFDREKIRNNKFDAIFISHYHDDHCSFESLDLIDRNTPIYAYCIFEELFILLKEFGFNNVHSLQLNQKISIESITVTAWPSLDRDVDSIFQIQSPQANILNVVDSWIDPETFRQLLKAGPWDLVLWPFQTMREIEVLSPSRATKADRSLPAEWIEQIIELNPKAIVPSSCQFKFEDWSWYNKAFFPISYDQFEIQMKNILPDCRVVNLSPGRSIVIENDKIESGQSLDWIRNNESQIKDYDYDESVVVPTTAEIAKNFQALDEIQTSKVYEFCEKNIFDKLNIIAENEDSYFSKFKVSKQGSKIWKLIIFDHQGTSKSFSYQFTSDGVTCLKDPGQDIDWQTEISINKMYGALQNGESLTSLYLRINDRVFARAVEENLQEVDLMEDPLLFCLYDQKFASYQKAQIKRLKA